MSWPNIMMLAASIPSYEKDKDGDGVDNTPIKDLGGKELAGFLGL
ncbi:hypothetical protein AB6805_30640 [Chitinophaga sp. RCC_12]